MKIIRQNLLICLLTALSLFIQGCGFISGSADLAWNETPELPDGSHINVSRTAHYVFSRYLGQMIWDSETITVHLPTTQASIVWHLSAPIGVIPDAIYLDDGKPRIVTRDTGISDFIYGCVYTNHHRLFSWTSTGEWRYDPYARMHISYRGQPNLVRSYDYYQLSKQIKDHGITLPQPRFGTSVIDLINTKEEKPLCVLTKKQARYQLDEVLNPPST